MEVYRGGMSRAGGLRGAAERGNCHAAPRRCPRAGLSSAWLNELGVGSDGGSTMSEKKPIVVRAVPLRGACPVCGKTSYSPTGMHPQCAMARADADARAIRKAAGIEVRKVPSKKSWCKPCPKCKRQIPARRVVCDCGHQFPSFSAGATSENADQKPQTMGTRR